ncbi:uncharacterized protein METZ01_LOCUS194595, partial [marine metagenome]
MPPVAPIRPSVQQQHLETEGTHMT